MSRTSATNQYQETDWIQDWDYKRILPEQPKVNASAEQEDEDMDMEMIQESVQPLPVKNSSTNDPEMAIAWARIPKYLSDDDASSMSDDEAFQTLEFFGLNDDLAAFAPNFDQRNQGLSTDEAMDVDDSNQDNAPLGRRHRNKSRRSSQLSQPVDGGDVYVQEEKQDIFQRQRQIFEELRHKARPPPPPRSPSPEDMDFATNPFDESKQNSYLDSPVSVSESLFSGDFRADDYQSKVLQFTEKTLFERQQKFLQESMKRTLESRKALRMMSRPDGFERGAKLTQVLERVDSTSLKISQTLRV